MAFVGLTWLAFLPRLLYWHERFHLLPIRWRNGVENTVGTLFRRSGQDPWFVQGELLVAVTLAAVVVAWRGRPPGRVGRAGLLGLWLVVFLFELNTVFGLVFMTQAPLFYDELFLLRHLLRLVGDLWQPVFLLYGLGGAGAFAALVLLAAFLVRTLVAALPALGRGSLAAGAGLWLLVGLSLFWHGVDDRRGLVRLATPPIVDNLRESAAVYRQVNGQVAASPYDALDDVVLVRKPDVHVIIVESYGQVVATIPALRETWEPRIRDMQTNLEATGWHTASAWCRSPISGGRSWLADASLFMGVRIFHESVYRHLLDQPEPRSLVRWFGRQGYETVLVAPADRARPGIELENLHRFSTTVFQKDLHYGGPSMGWGLVPDQYALEYAHQEVLDRIEGPVFSSFHGTTSHLPWDDIPPLVQDWRALGTLPGTFQAQDEALDDLVELKLKRYRSRPLKETPGYAGETLPQQQEPYRKAIDYELGVVEAHLAHLEDDALVVVLGDHQPPYMNKYASSYAVPMHLFARDPALLDEFLAQGFEPGLVPSDDAPVALNHEGFFSLLVRALARCCSDGPLPDWLPEGAGGREADPG